QRVVVRNPFQDAAAEIFPGGPNALFQIFGVGCACHDTRPVRAPGNPVTEILRELVERECLPIGKEFAPLFQVGRHVDWHALLLRMSRSDPSRLLTSYRVRAEFVKASL